MLFVLADSHQKLKLENIHDTLIILFDVPLNYKELAFLLKKNNHSSASFWWEHTKSCFKQNTSTFSQNSITQENIIQKRKF